MEQASGLTRKSDYCCDFGCEDGGWASVFRLYYILSPKQIDKAMSSLEQNDGALIEEAASAGD